MPWLVAAIGALIGGVANGIGAIDDINKTRKAAQDQLDYVEDMYKLQKERAEQDYKEATKQAEKNAKLANQQAELEDLSLDITERSVSNDINTAIDNLYLSQTSDAWNWNSAQMQASSSQGAALANIAGSGIRAGSSLSDAVLLESATNEAQLQFSQDAKRRSDNNNLASVLNGLAGTQVNIMGNRIGADVTRQNALDLVNSYAEGGYNYNIYQNQKEQMSRNYKYNKDQLNDTIDRNSWDNPDAWLKLGTGILTGAASGYQTGANLYDMAYEQAPYKTQLDDLIKKKTNKTTSTKDYSKLNPYSGGIALGW